MVSLRSAVWGPLLAVAAMAIGGCGGPSEEEKRDDRAAYVRDADKVCDTAIDKLAAGSQPRTYESLKDRVTRDEKTLGTAGDDLHELRDKLGDSASSEIKTFDERVDAVQTAMRRIADDADLRDATGTRRSAKRLRKSYDALYRAAGKVKLRRCGRGGNRAADVALFTVYRDEFFTATVDVNIALRGLRDNPQTPEAYRRYLHRSVPIVATWRRRVGRLSPPQVLRRSHRLLLRRTTRALGSARQLLKLLNRGQLGPGAQLVALRLVRQADALDAAERVVRRILRVPGGSRGGEPRSGNSSSV